MKDEWVRCCGHWYQRQQKGRGDTDTITFVILLHWWDDRGYTGGQFQWNDVYSRQTGGDYVVSSSSSSFMAGANSIMCNIASWAGNSCVPWTWCSNNEMNRNKIQELIRRWNSKHELFLRWHRTCRGQRLRPLNRLPNFYYNYLCKKWGDGGGGYWLVRMEWHSAGWSVSLPLLIFPSIAP